MPKSKWDYIQSISIGVRRGVEDSRRSSALRAGHSWNNPNAVSGVARPQGVET